VTEEHAVLLVGYNNTGEYWIAKNSWGTRFADGGFFRVSMLCLVHVHVHVHERTGMQQQPGGACPECAR
jgi:Papain family cysteine protease